MLRRLGESARSRSAFANQPFATANEPRASLSHASVSAMRAAPSLSPAAVYARTPARGAGSPRRASRSTRPPRRKFSRSDAVRPPSPASDERAVGGPPGLARRGGASLFERIDDL